MKCLQNRPVRVFLFFLLTIPLLSCNVLDGGSEFVESGIASWYGADYHGTRTANGEIYDMNTLTAAHKTLPFGSYVRVVNKDNGRHVTVRINNRGPYVEGRVIDLSRRSAQEFGIIRTGLAPVDLYLVKDPRIDGH
ncbi:MAG: septal ring lytic transglycosylase RlpA family protein [Balneolaceae bacterium]